MLVERKNLKLRSMYDKGNLSAEEFLSKLFDTKEGDRKRRNIENKYKKNNKYFNEK
ncbi:hypothetical protein [Peribacillus frigoritolerans]|uniref:hypothetical protein n=1 Tax=Peribacillus frigoritolerans TaxID=450367 RepID=UPI0032E36FA6